MKGRGKQRLTYLTSWCKWMTKQRIGEMFKRKTILTATNKKLWIAMIENALNEHDT